MAKPLHVVMLPWSAFGHLIPHFHLSVALAKSGVEVSFVSTPRNIKRLPKPPQDLVTLINFVEFPLPSLGSNELYPEGAEATVDFPSFDQIQHLKIAYDMLQHPVKKFVAEQSPDWIFCDFYSHWLVNIAQEYQVPILHFSVVSASFYNFLAPDLLVYNITNASGISSKQRVGSVLNGCQAVAIRSCPEFEGERLNLLEKQIGKPVIPVGLLTPENENRRDKITDDRWWKIFQWLDQQKPKSVVFVGFGSECKLTKDQVYEIAYGLELSELPFLWALRKPEWAADDLEALPPCFNGDKGMVCIGWAPQLEILGNPSIGGSLFHAGWGSLIEILKFGHRLVVLPFLVDQPSNAKLLIEKGLALGVERREDGSFSRDDIAKALRRAMVSVEGERLTVQATEATSILNDKNLQEDYLESWILISLSFIEMENSISQILNTVTLLLAFFAITPTAESFCSEAMPIALSSSGFTLFAQALHRYNLTATTTGLTYFAPPDDALINFSLDATSVRGHVSNAGAFCYDSLLTIPHNTTLPTLRNTTLTVATEAGMVSFNDVLVIAPNLYFDGSCALHGVDGLLVPPSSTSSSSSGADLEFAKARMGTKSLPVSSRRRVSETFKAFVRFIRRANGPTRLEEDEEPGIP